MDYFEILMEIGITNLLEMCSRSIPRNYASCRQFLPSANELRKGNVFTVVCLSVHRGRWSPCHHYPWCICPHCTGSLLALDPSRNGTWGPPGLPQLVTSGDHHWRPVQTCSLDLTVQSPHWYWHLIATKACTVGRRVVHILLECFLVIYLQSRTGITGVQLLHG